MNINKRNIVKSGLNLLLILSISILIYNYTAYRIAKKKMDTIIEEMKQNNAILHSKLIKAERIAIDRLGHSLEKEYGIVNFKRIHKSYWNDNFENLINERKIIENKLSILGNSDYWGTSLKFKRDAITNRIYFGTEDYLSSLMEKYRLIINSKEIKINHENEYEYKIYSPASLDIIFQKIIYNFDRNRFDTISKHRKIIR